jgi:hypothetical protein
MADEANHFRLALFRSLVEGKNMAYSHCLISVLNKCGTADGTGAAMEGSRGRVEGGFEASMEGVKGGLEVSMEGVEGLTVSGRGAAMDGMKGQQVGDQRGITCEVLGGGVGRKQPGGGHGGSEGARFGI